MRILAFDLGTTLGWALLDAERGEGQTGGFSYLDHQGRARKLYAFSQWLQTWNRVVAEAPTVIAYERPHLRGWPATAMLVGMMGILEAWAAGRSLRVVSASTGEIKRFATARWNAPKEEVLSQMKLRFGDRLGWTTRPRAEPTDHEADAGALALFVEQGGGK